MSRLSFGRVGAGVALFSTGLLHVLLFPPFGISELAFVFLMPGLLLLSRVGSAKRVWWITFASGWISWLAILIWLRHVTPIGTILLSGMLAVFWAAWWVAAFRFFRGCSQLPWLQRLGILVGLSSLWVVLEWSRNWVLWGFPWLPLAASQWERAVLLQILPILGSGGLAWILVFFNVAMSSYLGRIVSPPPPGPVKGFRRFTVEFYIAILLVMSSVWLYSQDVRKVRGERITLGTVGVVQPYTEDKWEPEVMRANLDQLYDQTMRLGEREPDFIAWPESATPWPILSVNPAQSIQGEMEALASAIGRSILTGNMEWMEDTWTNGIFVIDPEEGVVLPYYAKRKLVPFGEYNPLGWLPFFGTFLPFDTDATPGDEAVILEVDRPHARPLRVGPLVCYEDVFSRLVRPYARAGVDFLLVATNNAWYGEEAGAFQHAAHSVLRAVEYRIPVLRVGNGGWSGWIDEFGHIRHVVTNDEGSIYFRGETMIEMPAHRGWSGTQTAYLRWGWLFPWFCLILSPVGFIIGAWQVSED